MREKKEKENNKKERKKKEEGKTLMKDDGEIERKEGRNSNVQ